MDYSFACQDADNGNRSVRSKLTRRTYDVAPASSPPDLHTAYARSSNISPRPMQVRTIMYSRDTPSTTQHVGQPSTANPVRRSVSGMKNLLPLKLSSAAPERSWPSSAPSHRTTFGMRLSLRIERPTSMSETTENVRGRRLSPQPRPKRYRDTPIYTEPGAPLPSPAYYTDDVRLRCSPGSVCDEACIINKYDNEKKRQHEHELKSLQETIEDICDGEGSVGGSYIEAVSRCSDLSFHCSGEAVFEDGASWLRSPLNIQNWPQPNALPRLQDELTPIEHTVETWLSDTSSCFDLEDDQLACATIVAPATASIVDVSPSPSSILSIKIPPRTSSLDNTPWPFTVPATSVRNSWVSFSDSPPITPADGDDGNAPSREPSFTRKFQPMLPQRRLDLAMTSPPLSSNSSPSSSTMAALNIDGRQTRRSESPAWPLPVENGLPESKEGILCSLEEWTSNFPSDMLLPDSACISTIRAHLFNTKIQEGTYHWPKLPSPLLSPFLMDRVGDTVGPPRMRSLRRRKTTDLSQHRRSSATTRCPPPLPTSFTSSSAITNHTIQSPDLQPLQNIFPNSSKTMRAALYAHLLAYIFVCSIRTSSLQAFPSTPSPRFKRRDTPYWSSNSPRMSQKAADILSMPIIPVSNDSNSSIFTSTYTSQSPELGNDFNTAIKAQALQEELRKCIFCLISVMDENFVMENMMGGESKDIESSSGMVFLHSLVEVVKSAEGSSACF